MAERVVGLGFLELGDRADLPGNDLFDRHQRLALRQREVAEALGVTGADVDDVAVGLGGAAEDPHQADVAGEGIGEGLKDQCREGRRRVGRVPLRLAFLVVVHQLGALGR